MGAGKNMSLDIVIDPVMFLVELTKAGYTMDEIAKSAGMTRGQLETLLKKNPEVWDLIDEAKMVPNRMVEMSLFKRAIGFPTKETHLVQGRPSRVIFKEIVPDVAACIFWLKNREPDKWRDVVDVNLSLRERMARGHRALSQTIPNRRA
jgi:hypothetical protein